MDSIGAKYNLDTVRDCIDLQGTFPENVELKFVLWSHGTYDGAQWNGQDDLELLAAHLEDADWVALETVNAENDLATWERVARESMTVNECFAGKRSGTMKEIVDSDTVTTFAETALSLGDSIYTRTGKVPFFFPVDNFDNSIMLQLSKYESGTVASRIPFAIDMRHREALTLRQLHSHAMDLSVDGQAHQIGVVYGAMHSLLPVAARTLGAPVSRVFVSKQTPEVTDTLSHIIRFSLDEEQKLNEVNLAEKAIRAATVTGLLLAKLRILPANVDGLIDARPLSWLFYRDIKNTLPPRESKLLIDSVETLSPAKNVDKKMGPLKKRKLQLAGKKLIDLAFEVYR